MKFLTLCPLWFSFSFAGFLPVGIERKKKAIPSGQTLAPDPGARSGRRSWFAKGLPKSQARPELWSVKDSGYRVRGCCSQSRGPIRTYDSSDFLRPRFADRARDSLAFSERMFNIYFWPPKNLPQRHEANGESRRMERG